MSKRQAATWLLLSLCLWAWGAALADEGSKRELQTSPSLELLDLQGKAHSLADYRGKVILVNFWASWCGPCITEIPDLRALHERLAGSPFEILAVNVKEGRFKVHKFSRLVDMPFPILLDTDGSAFAAWGAEVLPTTFLIDAEGRVRRTIQGPLDWDSEQVVRSIRALISEAPITQTVTLGSATDWRPPFTPGRSGD
jgi:thiol-disulfide isomerase/thioredoxin